MEYPKSLQEIMRYGLNNLALTEESREKIFKIQNESKKMTLIYQGFFISVLLADKIFLTRKHPSFIKKNPFIFLTFNLHVHVGNLILMVVLATKTEKSFRNNVIDILSEYEKEIAVLKLSQRFA